MVVSHHVVGHNRVQRRQSGTPAGIAAVVGLPETWLEASSALGLLETGAEECAPITEEHRTDICQGLTQWFSTEEEERRNEDPTRPADWMALVDRWDEAKETESCISHGHDS